jgi:hypothetical protein
MTWRELGEVIKDMDERFLDTDIQLYDVDNQVTYIDERDGVYEDDDDEDFLIDKNQPQIWFNWPEE